MFTHAASHSHRHNKHTTPETVVEVTWTQARLDSLWALLVASFLIVLVAVDVVIHIILRSDHHQHLYQNTNMNSAVLIFAAVLSLSSGQYPPGGGYPGQPNYPGQPGYPGYPQQPTDRKSSLSNVFTILTTFHLPSSLFGVYLPSALVLLRLGLSFHVRVQSV